MNSTTIHISVGYFENNQFAYPQQIIDSIQYPSNYNLNFFDVNEDGLKDYIFRLSSGNIREWNYRANLGDGVFSADSTYLCELLEYSILEHNADNNGMLDIVQIGFASDFWNYNVQTVYCFFNVNQNSSLVYDLVSPQEFIQPYQMISADLNQDGIDEIVTVSPVCPTINAVNVNIENELLRNKHLILDESGGRSVISGDWDMDGDSDLAYISEGSPQFGLNLAFQVAPNEFQDSLLSGSVNSWSPRLLKSDFDQDGDPDIIEYLGQAANKPFLWIFRNDGAGSFSPKEALSDTVYYLSGSVKIIDWNNDNYDDFIYTSSSQIIYYENIGGVTLAEPDTFVSSCGSCGGFYVTDTDNNGLKDIVYHSNTANGIVILKKIDGSAPFVSDTVAVGAGLSVNFVFDDLNADGVKDIISAVNDSLQIKVYLMGPAQTGFPLIAYTYPASITALGLADLNQDGLNDLFGRYTNGHKIFWAFRDPGNPLQFIPQQMTGEVQVFPNPGAGLLNIRCASDNLIDKVEIFSLDGKLCAQHQINPACDVQLKAPESNGVYLIRAYTQTGIHTTRFVCAGN